MTRKQQLQEMHLALEGAVEQLGAAQRVMVAGEHGAEGLDRALEAAFAEVVGLRNRVREALMRELATPPAGSCRRSARAWRRASASRSGRPSRAAIDPDPSTMKTVWRARDASVGRTGRAAAPARRTTARSWRNRRREGRSFCHGEAADTGLANSRHR
jgi:hypothetical protein